MKLPKLPENGMSLEIGHQILSRNTTFHEDLLEPLNGQYWMFKSDCPSLDLTYNLCTRSSRRIRYLAPAAERAAAHAMANPFHVLTGFGALALFGLPYLVDGTDTVLMSSAVPRNTPPSPREPAVVRHVGRPLETWTVQCGAALVQVVAPAVATVQALKLVRRGSVTWDVIGVPGVDAEFVRAVQLVDAVRRYLRIDPLSILEAAGGRLDQRWLVKVIQASSTRADSPKETELRLLVAQFADSHSFTPVEQMRLYRNEKLVTVFDLALLEPRIGIMYDGSHHDEPKQRAKDEMINIDAAAEGWTPARFSKETLHRVPEKLQGLI